MTFWITILHQKNANNLYCEKYDFKCSKLSDWKRHINTLKHKKDYQELPVTPTIYAENA